MDARPYGLFHCNTPDCAGEAETLCHTSTASVEMNNSSHSISRGEPRHCNLKCCTPFPIHWALIKFHAWNFKHLCIFNVGRRIRLNTSVQSSGSVTFYLFMAEPLVMADSHIWHLLIHLEDLYRHYNHSKCLPPPSTALPCRRNILSPPLSYLFPALKASAAVEEVVGTLIISRLNVSG